MTSEYRFQLVSDCVFIIHCKGFLTDNLNASLQAIHPRQML